MPTNSNFEQFWEKLSEKQQKCAELMDSLLQDEFQLTQKMRYQLPFYFRNSWICYLNPLKNGTLELAFTRANEFSQELNLLDFKGRKQVGSLEFDELTEETISKIRFLMIEAIDLDERVAYNSKRKGSKT